MGKARSRRAETAGAVDAPPAGPHAERCVSMLPVEGRAQSLGWKLTLTGDTGDCRNLGDSDTAGTPGNGFAFSPQSYRSAGDTLCTGTGFRRLGLLVEVDGAARGGEEEVVRAAIMPH